MERLIILFTTAALTILFFSNCKKEKVYSISGRLLLSRSNPVPIQNYKLQLYQGGSGGAPIALGTFPSAAEGSTDNNGYFTLKFKEGKGTFLGIPTSNTGNATLSGYYTNTSYPSFQIANFPYDNFISNEPLYLYKKVDTVYIKIKVFVPIAASDSFTIWVNQAGGDTKRMKKGWVAGLNSEIFLDTIYQSTFPYFDFYTKKYVNTISIYKNRNLMPLYQALPRQDSLADKDENKLIFTYNSY